MHAQELTTVLIAVAAALYAVSASCQESVSPVDNLDRLDNALLDLKRESGPTEENTSEIVEIRAEIAEIRLTLQRLQETLKGKLLAITDLEDENQRLRHALRVRYGREEAGLPPVPMPNRELIESVLSESIAKPSSEVNAHSTNGAGSYTVVSEWGRSPEVVAGLPGNVSSLIGMAIAVPAGTGQNELKTLGRDLRQKYAEYDNINIEIYDDVPAARRYADQGSSSEEHRVLSISKHRHSERDTIVIFPNGLPVEVQ